MLYRYVIGRSAKDDEGQLRLVQSGSKLGLTKSVKISAKPIFRLKRIFFFLATLLFMQEREVWRPFLVNFRKMTVGDFLCFYLFFLFYFEINSFQHSVYCAKA